MDKLADLTTAQLGEPRSDLTDEQLHQLLGALCERKAEDFRLLGYQMIDGTNIWSCLLHRYTHSGLPALYILVEDLISLQPHDFMNWRTLSLYK